MNRSLLALTLSLAAPATAAPMKVAVLELRHEAGLANEAVSYLTDRIRAAALGLPRDAFFVMTRENILDQLPPGTDLAACEGACEIETGRNVGADYVATGEVLTLGSEVRVSLKLHETRGGALLATDKASAGELAALETPVEAAARRLFGHLAGPRFAVTAPAPLPELDSAPSPPGGMAFSDINVDALEAYDAVVKFDRGPGEPEAKAQRWSTLAARHATYRDQATRRAERWQAYAKALRERVEARDRDWAKLSRLLRLEVVTAEEKAGWAKEFLDTYGHSVRVNPHAPDLWPHVRSDDDGTIAGSTWAGVDSDGDYYVYRFRSNGKLEYTSPTGTFHSATWRQTGSKVYLETNGRYSEYEGSIKGGKMTGRAWNRRGHEWSWSAERR